MESAFSEVAPTLIVLDGSNPRRSRPAAGQSKVSFENLGAISAVLAAFAAGVYVLGLAVLGSPIARPDNYEWTTSGMPRPRPEEPREAHGVPDVF
jgi:hypothetical protein